MTEAEIICNRDTNTAARLDLNAPSLVTSPSSPTTEASPGSKFHASSASPIRLSSVKGFGFCEEFKKSPKFTIWEWLGDAFLNFCNAHYLARRDPNLDPKLFGQRLTEIRSASTHTKCAENCFIGTDERSLHDRVANLPRPESQPPGRKACSDWLEAYFGVAFELYGFEDNKLWESGKEITMVGLNVMEKHNPPERGKKRLPVQSQVARDYSAFIFSFLITETVRSFADKHPYRRVYDERGCLSLMDKVRQDLCSCYPNLQQSDPPPTKAKRQFLAGIAERLNTEHDLSAVSKDLYQDLQRHPSVMEILEKLEDELRQMCDIIKRDGGISSRPNGQKERVLKLSSNTNSKIARSKKCPSPLEKVATLLSSAPKKSLQHEKTISNGSTAPLPGEQSIGKKRKSMRTGRGKKFRRVV